MHTDLSINSWALLTKVHALFTFAYCTGANISIQPQGDRIVIELNTSCVYS